MTDIKEDSNIELEIRINKPKSKQLEKTKIPEGKSEDKVKVETEITSEENPEVKPEVKLEVKPEENPEENPEKLELESTELKTRQDQSNKGFFDPLKITILVIIIATGLIYHFTTGPNEVDFATIETTQQDNTNYSNPDENKKPIEFTNESKEKGAQAFTETCGGCHSAFGKGLGSIALEPRIAGLSAEDILTTVKTSPNMFAVRSKANLELIVAYLVKTSSANPDQNSKGQPNVIKDNDGKFFFYKACGKCHKVRGFGDGPEDLTKKVAALGLNGVLTTINNPPVERMRLHLEGLTEPQKMAIAQYVSGGSASQSNNISAQEGGIGLYENNFCSQCHTIHGDGGNVGPDLTHIGSARTEAWLEEYLTNPKTVYPDTVMPVVPLTRDEIISLSNYLASLK